MQQSTRYVEAFSEAGPSLWNTLLDGRKCPHAEMKLKRNSFETVLKLFRFGFISIFAQFRDADIDGAT